jgi:hypothetical protein
MWAGTDSDLAEARELNPTASGQDRQCSDRAHVFQFTPETGLAARGRDWPVRADTDRT